MKQGFKNSSKIKVKKSGSGWYLTIPFRYATPGAIGESSVFSGTLPADVYKILQQKSPTETIPGGKTKSGNTIKVAELPAELQIPKVRKEVIVNNEKFTEYTHKSSIFAGIGKSSKFYENTASGQYISFRRVSDLSEKNSWLFPGLSPKLFSEKAVESINIRQIVDFAGDEFLSKIR
jgi:hypothetical protein